MSEAVKAASPGNPGQLLTPPPGSAAATTGSNASGSGSGSTILMQTPPPALTALNAGQIIRAVATGQMSDGKALLDTRFGQIALALPVETSRGQVLRLQIARAAVPLHLLLLSVSEPEESTAPQTEFSRLRPGDPLSGRFRPGTPDSPRDPARAGATGPAPQGGRPAAATAAQTATPLNLRLLTVLPPGKPAGPATADPLIFSGTVIGTKAGSGTLLQSASGTLLLPGVVNAPKGAQVTLQILGTPGTVLPATATGALAQSVSTLTHGWPALQEAIDATRTIDPGRTAAIVAGSVPTTGPNLTAGLALFLNAVFGARIHDWLGRDVLRSIEALRQGDLASRLTDDFAELARLAGEPLGNEWRAVMVPLMHDDALHQIRLYLRAHDGHPGEQDEVGEAEAGTRFVVEVELSRLGALQLDGLVRTDRFDLMVRTHRDLPPPIRNEIATLFAAANAEMSAAGQIGFQVTRDFPVAPLEGADLHAVGVFA